MTRLGWYIQLLSRVQLFAAAWTVAGQAPLSMWSFRQEYWSMLPFLPPGDLLDPGIKSTFPAASASAGRFFTTEQAYRGFPGGSDGQESACNAGDPGSIPASGRCHGEGNSNPPPVFLHGKSHGQRSLAGHSSWGCKELGMIDQLTISVSGLQWK